MHAHRSYHKMKGCLSPLYKCFCFFFFFLVGAGGIFFFFWLSCIACGRSVLWPRIKPRLWHPTAGLLPGKFHGWRSLVGCGPWGQEELDMTEWFHFHFSFSRIGEGNGNPLQCSCLENPRDGGAWWAAVYGVAQSWTRLKRLSSMTLKAPSSNHWTAREVPKRF